MEETDTLSGRRNSRPQHKVLLFLCAQDKRAGEDTQESTRSSHAEQLGQHIIPGGQEAREGQEVGDLV